LLRWIASISLWNWRILLRISATAELAAFLTFYITVRRHPRNGSARRIEMDDAGRLHHRISFSAPSRCSHQRLPRDGRGRAGIPHWQFRRYRPGASMRGGFLHSWGRAVNNEHVPKYDSLGEEDRARAFTVFERHYADVFMNGNTAYSIAAGTIRAEDRMLAAFFAVSNNLLPRNIALADMFAEQY
jgi:hypothetical protein